MRGSGERRIPHAFDAFPLEDSNHELVAADRREIKDRRIENLNDEERQLLLSEMPWLTFYKLT